MAHYTPRRNIPLACRRQVTWGEHLELRVNRTTTGLKPIVDAITTAIGPYLGTRNTYAKLFDLEHPPAAATKEYDRAYVLLLMLSEEPGDWGIDEDLVSEAWKRSRDLLVTSSRCILLLAQPKAAA